MGIRSIALTGLFIFACFYTLYFAREFFLLIVLAIVFMFLLNPVVRAMKKIRIPEFVGAAVVIIGMFAFVGFVGYKLSGPLTEWLRKAPEIGQKLQDGIRNFKKPVEQVSKAGEQVEKLTSISTEG